MKALFIAVFCMVTLCVSAWAQTLQVPFELPTRGEPFLFNQKQYPIENWREKSGTDFPWFVEQSGGWYVNWDAEAVELSYLVVHHSATGTSATADELSSIDLKRLYDCPAVYGNANYKSPYIYGLPPHSSHVINGKETFIPYHHLIYSDGRVVTTLSPFKKVGDKYFVDMIGWGSGKWSINCKAVQICLVGTYSKTNPPSPACLSSLDKLVRFYKQLVPGITIAGHKEVRPNPTACPGDWWEDYKP